jgi:pyruvate,water dikinase
VAHSAPPLVLDLDDPASVDPLVVGAKAARLAQLMARALPVPPGVVITTHALRGAIAAGGLVRLCERAGEELRSGDRGRAVAAGAAVAEGLRILPIPHAVERLFVDAYTALLRRPIRADTPDRRAPLFVVRSSASDEDGGERSHAGQYESRLNLRGLPPIWDAVREVWASWYSARAIGYRLDAGGDGWGAFPPMAVLVQRMVHPRASGMLFTVNPVNGSRREMALEAASGLGEALAQGRVHPDYFVISRGEGRPLRVSERGIARKERRLETTAPGSGQVVFRDVPIHEQRRPALTDEEALEIARLGLAAEDLLGGPADIEWTIDREGFIFLVQARPITAVQPGAFGASAQDAFRGRPILWTQRFCGERWPDLATPMGWSLIQPILHHFVEWKDASKGWLDGTEPTQLYRGRPYFNITIFRHLVFRLPGRNPPEVILEMFPAEEQRAMRNAAPYLPDWRLVRAIFSEGGRESRGERYRYNVLTNHREWEEFRPRLDAEVSALPLDFNDPADGLRAIDRGSELIVEYLRIHLLSLLFAHLCYQILDVALRSWVGEGGEALRSALVADAGDNRTLQVNQALWELAEAAKRAPEVRRWLERDLPGGVDHLSEVPGGADFERVLRRFLVDYGHRSAASWEVFATRWADDPGLVLRMVAGTLRAGAAADPAVHAQARRRDRIQAERLVRQRMTRTAARRLLPWRQVLFARLLDLTRRYMALRENQRFSYDRLLFQIKRIFERTGALLERDGRLAAGEAIVFLKLDELRELVAGRLEPAKAEEIAADRKALFEADRVRPHPDFLEEGNRHLSADRAHGNALEGLGISPGIVRGTVRVLKSPAEVGNLKPGDILVARSTDPGWTPLFLTAGGLILELGSYLSHGAVVAREYRLPAVVNVEGACRILEDGMDVTVDGDRGRVLVHGQKRAREGRPTKCEEHRTE